MKRDDLIEAMWFQTDLDDVDVPVFNAKMFLTEAFERTAAVERHWPLYETVWTYNVTAGSPTVALDADTSEISAIMSDVTGYRLSSADHSFAEESYLGRTGRTSAFSVWGQQLYLWPVPSSDTVLTVRGWRKPDPTWIEDPALEVDLDSRLHLPLLHYGIALVYAQQEDGELENQYMRRWAQSIADLKKDILRPSTYRPVVLNGGEDQHLYGGRSTWSRVGFDNL
tara:strand:- start:618 stop:1292 length:675 start_codon:yes stop_codon:yes gene_type:complete